MDINLSIIHGSKILRDKYIPNSQLDAEILMGKTINKDRNYILLNYNNPINKNDLNISFKMDNDVLDFIDCYDNMDDMDIPSPKPFTLEVIE